MMFWVRRGWWKPWDWTTRTWLFVIAISTILCPFVVRWICLWQVPDVALPFVVDDVIGDDVPENEDAFTAYALVIQALSAKSKTWLDNAVEQATRSHEPTWDERLDSWLIDNADICAQFERASSVERAQSISPRKVHVNTLIPTHQNLRTLAKLILAEALRCQRAGETEQAWKLYGALFRCAGHAQNPGFSVANGIGRAIRIQTYRAVAEWAAEPSLTADRLRSARLEVSNAASTRLKSSDVMKVEYLLIRNTTERDYFPDFLYPKWKTGSLYEPVLSFGKRFYLWTIGQPEVSMRLSRQLLVNSWDQIDLPLHRRRNVIRQEYPMVFELDSERRRGWGQLTAEKLIDNLESRWGRHLIEIEFFASAGRHPPNLYDLDVAHRNGEAHLSMIDLVLAIQEFQRRHLEFPTTLEQLVPECLSALPFDPMSPSGALFNYRREANGDALIWSLGLNHVDDGGDIEGQDPKDTGYRLLVNSQIRR